MARIETTALSAEIDERFGRVLTLGADLSAKVAPETMTSPGMGLGLLEIEARDRAKGAPSVDRRIERMLGGETPIERKPLTVAGREGVTVVVQDDLRDDDGKKVKWLRRRALLLDAERDVFVHATAMYAKADRAWVEAAFFAMLDSVAFKASAAETMAAIDEGVDLLAAALERAKAAADETAARVADDEKAREAANLWAPAPDVETRFDAALSAVDLADRREALRAIAIPCVALVEADEPHGTGVGLSRIGGDPDLVEGAEWPRDPYGLQLNFLAQVDLADLPLRDPALPATGLLSFFVGVDLGDGTVLYAPEDARLVRHALPKDAEDVSLRARRMIVWDKGRFVVSTPADGELAAETERDGRIRFLRAGEPIAVLASEYEFARAERRLRAVSSLMVPFRDERYAAAGLDDSFDFWEAVRERMRVRPRGPHHQMFGLLESTTGGESPAEVAAKRAEQAGWNDRDDPAEWFLLMRIHSGGDADFCFGDAGEMVYVAPKRDAARGDFSRVVAFCESS